MAGARHEPLTIMGMLLEHDADVNERINEGWAALWRQRNEAVDRLMLVEKADIGVRTKNGRTLLAGSRASINAKDNNGFTVLHLL
jgi:ankyrin repeat protein